jgi:hypothetical protein
MVRDGIADHGGFTSFQFVKPLVEEGIRLAVAEAQHPDVSSRCVSKIYSALQPNNPQTTPFRPSRYDLRRVVTLDEVTGRTASCRSEGC